MRNVTRISFGLMALALVSMPTVSFAEWQHGHKSHGHDYRNHGHHGYHRYHSYPSFGFRFSISPSEVVSVSSGGRRYYYSDGVYYNRVQKEYVVINPPVGAVVSWIPPEFQAVNINGVTYYTHGGIYYVYTRYGYQLVPTPVTVIPQSVLVASAPVVTAPAVTIPSTTTVTAAADESFTVNVPNNQGGYTAVLLKRTDKGFTGPQGELYTEFPTVAQLKTMYVK